MTDDLHQLERDYPTRPGKDLPAVQYHLLLAIIFSLSSALSVSFHIEHARRAHPDSWLLNALSLCAAISLPWAGALVGYLQIKKSVLAAGASTFILREILIYGSRGLVFAYGALMIVLDATLTH